MHKPESFQENDTHEILCDFWDADQSPNPS